MDPISGRNPGSNNNYEGADSQEVISKRVPKILCIGAATQDVFLINDWAFLPRVGEDGQVLELPLGQKIGVDDIVVSTGGNVTNAAVTFARQGLQALYAWVLGNDVPAQAILRELVSENVDISFVTTDTTYRTSYSTVLVATGGERIVLDYHGTTLPDDGGKLDLSAIHQADWLYLSGLNNMDLLAKVLVSARQNNVKVMLNPARKELKEVQLLKQLLPYVEVLIMNKEEAGTLVGDGDIVTLTRSLHSFCPVTIVSDGPNGVAATDGRTILTAGMYEDVSVVDRTGAGDAFGSGFLAAWVRGGSLVDAITFASANSTSVISKIGTKTGILRAGAVLHEMGVEEQKF